jgi:hypothetical protein
MGADHRTLVLLTGASGYIGGRLLKALEKAGWPLRCLARRPDFLRPRIAQQKWFKPIAWMPVRLRRQWLECTRRITWSTPWALRVSSKRMTGTPHRTSPTLHESLGYSASSIWVD